jgi:hypothetical protein
MPTKPKHHKMLHNIDRVCSYIQQNNCNIIEIQTSSAVCLEFRRSYHLSFVVNNAKAQSTLRQNETTTDTFLVGTLVVGRRVRSTEAFSTKHAGNTPYRATILIPYPIASCAQWSGSGGNYGCFDGRILLGWPSCGCRYVFFLRDGEDFSMRVYVNEIFSEGFGE